MSDLEMMRGLRAFFNGGHTSCDLEYLKKLRDFTSKVIKESELATKDDRKVPVVHYNYYRKILNIYSGSGLPGRNGYYSSACNVYFPFSKNKDKTRNLNKVTCKTCLRTKVFKEAFERRNNK